MNEEPYDALLRADVVLRGMYQHSDMVTRRLFLVEALHTAYAAGLAAAPGLVSADMEEMRAKIERYEGNLCLICGATEPCRLKDDEYSPCTFDPNPIEAAKAFHECAVKARASMEEMKRALATICEQAAGVAGVSGLAGVPHKAIDAGRALLSRLNSTGESV